MSARLKPRPVAHNELVFVRRPTEPRGFAESSMVALVTDTPSHEGATLPAGTLGAIVSVYGGGDAYLVEFPEPAGTLATVDADKLRAA